MDSLRPFIRNAAFNPESIKAMTSAFEKAKALIHDKDAERKKPLIRIVTLASCGELDPDKLTAAAVKSFTAWSKL